MRNENARPHDRSMLGLIFGAPSFEYIRSRARDSIVVGAYINKVEPYLHHTCNAQISCDVFNPNWDWFDGIGSLFHDAMMDRNICLLHRKKLSPAAKRLVYALEDPLEYYGRVMMMLPSHAHTQKGSFPHIVGMASFLCVRCASLVTRS